MMMIGIDLGTTSVKIILVSSSESGSEIVASTSRRHDADIFDFLHPEYSQQNPSKICAEVEQCLDFIRSKVRDDTMSKVKFISICGQMHGCMLWNAEGCEGNEISYFPCSNLTTWQDRRCRPEFLKSLPLSENCIPVSTGFGCATLFWMRKYGPGILKKYSCAGTVMDYVASCLCDLKNPVISTHNAMSWGYYNFCEDSWNVRILEDNGFPTHLLPEIVRPGTAAGTLHSSWHGIPQGTKILSGLGDMQCSVLSCDPEPSAGVFNLSTSAQLSTTSPLQHGKAHYNLRRKHSESNSPDSLICVPYFDNLCLWTSASLNGGAVFEMFAGALHDWTKKFVPTVTVEEIYTRLQEDDREERKSSLSSALTIHPTILGERHAPDKKGSVINVGPGDVSVSIVASELARGIIKNVFNMFHRGKAEEPPGELSAIWGCGTAFEKNRLFRLALEELSGVPCRFDRSMDAAFGAVVAATRYAK